MWSEEEASMNFYLSEVCYLKLNYDADIQVPVPTIWVFLI